MSARTRLTVAFTLGITFVGISMTLAVYVAMAVLPDYQIGPGSTPAITVHTDRGTEVSTRDSTTAVTIQDSSDLLRVLLGVSGVVLVVTILAGCALSWRFAGRVLAPVSRITHVIADASHGAGARIPVREPHDEFGRLASTFNEMLDRLDHSWEAQRRFAANAAHELRTPLATTQAMIDAARTMSASDPSELLGRLREMNTRSITTVNALLELASAQADDPVTDPTDFGAIATQAVERYADAAAARGVSVEFREPASVIVNGDPMLLSLLVDNLVSNAIRYNHVGGHVLVAFDSEALVVTNDGPVVDPDHVPRLTEPFFRAAGRVAGSTGVGLALVEAVAHAHGMTLTLCGRAGGGLTVRVHRRDGAEHVHARHRSG